MALVIDQKRWVFLTRLAIRVLAQLVTGVRAIFTAGPLTDQPTIYFANHRSHGDFVLIWSVMPTDLRQRLRPVAGEDYWLRSRLTRFIGLDVFNAVLVPRGGASTRDINPLEAPSAALAAGESIIFFPEGTRNTTDGEPLPFKSGLYHLALQHPDCNIVPVWVEGLHRVLPKGAWLPVPVACEIVFGAPLTLETGESKIDFLTRARAQLMALGARHD